MFCLAPVKFGRSEYFPLVAVVDSDDRHSDERTRALISSSLSAEKTKEFLADLEGFLCEHVNIWYHLVPDSEVSIEHIAREQLQHYGEAFIEQRKLIIRKLKDSALIETKEVVRVWSECLKGHPEFADVKEKDSKLHDWLTAVKSRWPGEDNSERLSLAGYLTFAARVWLSLQQPQGLPQGDKLASWLSDAYFIFLQLCLTTEEVTTWFGDFAAGRPGDYFDITARPTYCVPDVRFSNFFSDLSLSSSTREDCLSQLREFQSSVAARLPVPPRGPRDPSPAAGREPISFIAFALFWSLVRVTVGSLPAIQEYDVKSPRRAQLPTEDPMSDAASQSLLRFDHHLQQRLNEVP